MDLITVKAKTYDEAITQALIELQTTSEHMYVEVVQKETSGLFGVLGGKYCIIKAGVMSEEEEAAKKAADAKAKIDAKKAEEEAKTVNRTENKEDTNQSTMDMSEELRDKIAKQNAQISQRRQQAESASKKDEDTSTETADNQMESKPKAERQIKPISQEEAAQLSDKVKSFLNDLFSAMGVEASTEIAFDHEVNEMCITLAGNEMGLLIGKRGQTLDSLQYLSSLVVNKHHDGYIRVKIDTENYRERRQEKLETLAKNIAHKVARTGAPVSLEPMNPYERRIIHSALQGDRYVTTDSEGEDPYRHIVVKLKSGVRAGGYGRRSGGHRPRQ